MLESRVEHILTAYYSLRVLRWLMIFLYFTSEILLVLLLVLLPIQIAFEWLISSVQ